MSVTGHTSGNLNEIRAYPFADTASLRDDVGALLPEYLLVDCHLWWPDLYGAVGCVSSATVSPGLITILFAAWSGSEITPLAALHVSRPSLPYRSYALTALQSGVAGWAAVGNVPSSDSVSTWRFSDPARSTLLPRLAQAYPSLPVQSLGKSGNPLAMVGRVRFAAGSGISITEQTRTIAGQSRRCVVFSLAPDQLPALYEQCAGPCGKRPESNNCTPPSIRTINGVVPDANGRIFIEVDSSSGAISGAVDDPVETPEDVPPFGILLNTGVELGALCRDVEFSDVYDDECYSSLLGPTEEPESESSSSSVPESSSLSVQTVVYDWSSLLQLRDWSIFDEQGDTHAIDWRLTLSHAWNSGTDVSFENGLLVPFARAHVDDNVRRMRCNAWAYDGAGSATFSAQMSFAWDEVEALPIGSGETTELSLELGGRGLDDENGFGWRLRVSYSRLDPHTLRAVIELQRFDGAGWSIVPGASAQTYDHGVFESSSSLADRLYFNLSLAVSREPAPDECSSSWDCCRHYALSWTYEALSEAVVFDPWSDAPCDYDMSQFFSVRLERGHSGAPSSPLSALTLRMDALILAGDLTPQQCNDADFISAASRVVYALDYQPDSHWSNDFGTTRAVQQLDLLPAGYEMDVVTPSLDGVVIDYGQQALDSVDVNHRYAILRCENSVVGNYVISAAFRYVSGSPKVGIAIGYQDGSNDVFWAVMIDLRQRRISYGQHVIGHLFQPSGWINLPDASAAGWPYDWHRFVVRVSGTGGGAPYAIAAWVDPYAVGESSSSENLTKTISVDYDNPVYLTTGKTQWIPGTVSSSQFADGPPGVYIYGGRAHVAEMTISPVGQAIVVPNKVPWLPV